MKIPLMYGALLAVIGAVVTFGCYFAGLHDTPDKLQTAQWIGNVVGLIASIACFSLAMRDTRAQMPADRPWSYGSALGTGVLTGLSAAVIGAVLAYVYFALVNPQFGEMVNQAQIAKLQERGLTPTQIEAASNWTRKFTSPIVMTIAQAIAGFVWAVILALIVAVFFRKPSNVQALATETPAPPPLS